MKICALRSVLVSTLLLDAESSRGATQMYPETVALMTVLKQTEYNITSTLPQRVDELTTLMSVRARDTTLHYWYKVEKTYSADAAAQWPSAIRAELLKTVCNSGLARLLDLGGSYRFHYLDKNNVTLASEFIEPDDC